MNPNPLFNAIDTREGLEAAAADLAKRLGVPLAEPEKEAQ